MPLNAGKEISSTSPPGPAINHENGRRRRSRSPATRTSLYQRRPSMERISDVQGLEAHEIEKKFPDGPLKRTSSSSSLAVSKTHWILDLYFWMLLRAAFLVGTVVVFPVPVWIPLSCALAILYLDIFLPLSHPGYGISRKAVLFSFLILLGVGAYRYRDSLSFTSSKFTAQELLQVENQVRKQSSSLVNSQVSLLDHEISKLRSQHGEQIPNNIISEMIQRELYSSKSDLSSAQKQQILTVVAEYFHQNPDKNRNVPSQNLNYDAIEPAIREIIGEVTAEWRREIRSMKSSVSKLSDSSLRKAISEWVEGEVKGHKLSEGNQPIDEQKLKLDARAFHFSPEQDAIVEEMISKSMETYVALYSRLVRPHATFETQTGTLVSSPSPYIGEEHFGFWKVDLGQVLVLDLTLEEAVYPFLFVLGAHYGTEKIQGNAQPQFWCAPSKFSLTCGETVIGSGSFSNNEPALLYQDFSLDSSHLCSKLTLRVQPSESEVCVENNQAKILFKHRIYGFPNA